MLIALEKDFDLAFDFVTEYGILGPLQGAYTTLCRGPTQHCILHNTASKDTARDCLAGNGYEANDSWELLKLTEICNKSYIFYIDKHTYTYTYICIACYKTTIPSFFGYNYQIWCFLEKRGTKDSLRAILSSKQLFESLLALKACY